MLYNILHEVIIYYMMDSTVPIYLFSLEIVLR